MKRPHRTVLLVIPKFADGPAQTINKLDIQVGGTDYVQKAIVRLWRYFVEKARIAATATTHEASYVDEKTGQLNSYFTVKGAQHQQFFEAINKVMNDIGVADYWIEDSERHEWLAGTYKDPNHKSL